MGPIATYVSRRAPSRTLPPPCPRWKRALDLGICMSALPVLAFATLLMGIIIFLRSPGPIFFRQERVGYRGRRFWLYKFRTMHPRSHVAAHQLHLEQLMRTNAPMEKLDARGDARLIPGGWLLRATGIDELPQLINVLRGEMTIVGPRPCIPYEYEQYTSAHRKRLNSVPGLTGLWQVSGKNRTTFEQMVELDVAYEKRKSPWLDLRIIALTLPALSRQLFDTVQRPKTAGAACGTDRATAPQPNQTALEFRP